MKYVDVILPLPLEGFFTYSVPTSLDAEVERGRRVLVPLGRNKTYVAIIVGIHNVKPDFKCRDILRVLDAKPILLEQQLKLWSWISDYYMSSVGDVMVAALPAGLKEVDAFRPKMEQYVGLGEKYRSERSLHIALDQLKRAPKQLEVFIVFLALSHWDEVSDEVPEENILDGISEITRDELMNASRCSAQVIKTLVTNGFLNTYEREVGRLNSIGEPHLERIQKLSDAQQTAYNQILMSFLKHNITLLHGVTSSGKTEIYIHLIKQALERKQQVLYLLPEIALTVQIRERLQRIFGDRLGIYHSKYSDAERVEIWQKQLSSHPYDVILGARSAVLLPFQNLGLVIIDEEHETSFKQQDPAPRYHARSVAIMLAQMYGAKTLLGTATPSFESYYNAQSEKFGHVTLSTRYKGVELPEIQVVDIKDLQHRKMMNGPFSPDLISAIRSAINSGEQVILFQNRRGFAPMIECKECGWVPHCSRCDVSLTYHRTQGVLSCHYCGSVYPVPSTCPNCGSESLISRGYGTEKIEDKVLEIFPDIKVARMDLDTTRSRHAYERIITDFSAGRTQLLIGTQMVTKGLDFDNVSVVGILNADSMLNYPDFRAYEHAFMMMSQVSGRAGRRGKRGRVILQTKSPQLPVIRQVVSNDYEQFFNQQLEERHDFCYPPYQRLIDIYLKHKDAKLVDAAAKDMVVRLQQYFGSRVLGPDRPSVSMIKTMNIRKIVLKLELGIDIKKVRECLRAVRSALLDNPRNSSIQVYFDVDPL